MMMVNRFSRFHYKLVRYGAKTPLESLLVFALIPLAFLYGMILWIRNLFYDLGIFQSYNSTLPVISIGNITAGGTGKTPAVDFLVKAFIRQGKRPAVVSRGYGGTFAGCVGVVSDSSEIKMDVLSAGDEPFLLAKRNPDCSVLIARKRVDAVRKLENESQVDIIILDDGFQHRALQRDVDIVLLDAVQPLGNGWPLPAGNLREFKRGLKRSDILFRTKCCGEITPVLQAHPVFNCHHRLSENAIELNGSSMPIIALQGRNILAFSGIANPDNFFNDLKNTGLVLSDTICFADHVDYSDPVIRQKLLSKSADVDVMITTEKDAVKLVSDMFELPCYYVPIDMDISEADELMETLTKLIWRR